MKKLLLLMVAALSIMFTQCKKTEVGLAAEGRVNITLSVDGGSKVVVTPGNGEVKFESGDVIYVASDGRYVGTLTHDGSKFAGTIYKPTLGQPLFFYFLGNKTPEMSHVAGTTTSIAVNITDQSEKLPVICAAESHESYSSSTTNYTATLLNKCGLVKFSAAGYTGDGTITVKKMNNKVTVDLSKNLGDGAFTNSKDGEGLITLNKVGGDYWAILLPQDEVTGGTHGDAYSSDSWFGTYGTVCAISDNSYVNTSVAVTLAQIGIGTFSVGASTTVAFSPGLMYWDGDSFEFETSQTDFQPTADGTWNSSHVNHFFWSKTASVAYAESYDDDSASYSDVFFTNDQSDQTKPNSGFTVNEETGIWRTLTRAEWVYLLNVDNAGSGARTQTNRFAKAKVSDVNGLLIFPDGYNGTTVVTGIDGIAEVNNKDVAFPGISIPNDIWTTMQSADVVFLPAASYRIGGGVSYVGIRGNYWSSSPLTLSDQSAYQLYFFSSNVDSQNYNFRECGYCVRLVR